MSASRLTGLQTAQGSVRAQLEAWRQQMAPREYETLLDVLTRMLTHERRRTSFRPTRKGTA